MCFGVADRLGKDDHLEEEIEMEEENLRALGDSVVEM